MISTFVPLLLEGALRALLAAVAVWAGLRALRVSNVVAQKAAWGLVLAAAFVMPFAPHWMGLRALRLPSLPLPAMPWDKATVAATPVAARPVHADGGPELTVIEAPVAKHESKVQTVPMMAADRYPAPAISTEEFPSASQSAANTAPVAVAPVVAPQTPPVAKSTALDRVRSVNMATVLWMVYLGVFVALLLRLLVGLGTALRLWVTARPLTGVDDCDPATGIPIRFSTRVASPINIGSGVILPADFGDWDAEKLRVVLAHERSHIRQGDFYLQLLAGLYASLFWFSPLGWWLKRKLCELGEAISDRAGLEEAASRSSYAQLLLEFAALPRPTLTGVAMARTSHLAQRIERLLNESSFRQAFAAGGRRALFAVLLVPVALLAATALVRVDAATTPSAQVEGQSTPEQVTVPAPAAVPAQEAAPAPPATPSSEPGQEPTPAATPAPPSPPSAPGEPGVTPMAPLPPMPAMDEMPPMPPTPGAVTAGPEIRLRVQPEVRVHPEIHVNGDGIRVRINAELAEEMAAAREEARAVRGFGFNYTMNGEPYALVGDPGSKTRFNGDWEGDGSGERSEEIEKARKVAHGHFLWFRHEGKSYVVDDPSVVSQVEAMNKSMDEIGEQMRALGKQMRELGQKQRDEGKQMRDVTVPTPDLSKEMAELQAAVEALRTKQGGTISQKELGELQGKIGRIQGELGSLQGKIVMQQMNMNGGMGKFGEEQGKLGGEMGELGSKMGELARENHTKVQGIIDDSMKNGKARPVE